MHMLLQGSGTSCATHKDGQPLQHCIATTLLSLCSVLRTKVSTQPATYQMLQPGAALHCCYALVTMLNAAHQS